MHFDAAIRMHGGRINSFYDLLRDYEKSMGHLYVYMPHRL